MSEYLHQLAGWWNFTREQDFITTLPAGVRNQKGRIPVRMESLGLNLRNQANIETLTPDILKSTEIEGEFLNPEQVRPSLLRKMGLEWAGAIPNKKQVDNMVEMMPDTSQNCGFPLTNERLFDWHAALSATGHCSIYRITLGNWGKNSTGLGK